VVRKNGKVLLGRRLSEHGKNTWCFPGGHLEYMETLEECAVREVREEAGISIKNIKVISATNDIHQSGKHYITVFVFSDWRSGNTKVMEPDKMVDWEWFEWKKLPKPLFLATQNFVNLKISPLKS
jgi:8-oxo-dGTP diphosphatase